MIAAREHLFIVIPLERFSESFKVHPLPCDDSWGKQNDDFSSVFRVLDKYCELGGNLTMVNIGGIEFFKRQKFTSVRAIEVKGESYSEN